MAKVMRTSVRPGRFTMHVCKDKQGRRKLRTAKSGSYCRRCDTQIVYVFSNDPGKKS